LAGAGIALLAGSIATISLCYLCARKLGAPDVLLVSLAPRSAIGFDGNIAQDRRYGVDQLSRHPKADFADRMLCGISSAKPAHLRIKHLT
jgi:hypothetical protein